MLLNKTDSSKYIAEFKDRFSNFCQKSPILVSFVTTALHVQVKHENSGTIYTFEWDFGTPVKTFIHEIKEVLSDQHYPRIAKVSRSMVPYSSEEIADIIAERASQGEVGIDVPAHRVVESSEIFRIDRVIAMKDIFLIQSESDKRLYRYHMDYSSILFLKSYRSGRFSSIEEAGEFFFAKSELLNEIDTNG